MAIKTLQELLKDCNGSFFNLLDDLNTELLNYTVNRGVLVSADLALVSRLVTPIYPITVDEGVFQSVLNGLTDRYIFELNEWVDLAAADLAVKHKREYGERVMNETDDTSTSNTDNTSTSNTTDRSEQATSSTTDDPATDITTNNTYFEASGSYHVEPTQRTNVQIGQRKGSRTENATTNDSQTGSVNVLQSGSVNTARNRTDSSHIDVEYDARTPWEQAQQVTEYYHKGCNILLDWLFDSISNARVWRSYGV